jgi:hypothetical protein
MRYLPGTLVSLYLCFLPFLLSEGELASGGQSDLMYTIFIIPFLCLYAVSLMCNPTDMCRMYVEMFLKNRSFLGCVYMIGLYPYNKNLYLNYLISGKTYILRVTNVSLTFHTLVTHTFFLLSLFSPFQLLYI